MSRILLLALAGVSALAITTHAVAQTAPTPTPTPTPGADSAQKAELEEIIVTARREAESLQNVPVSIVAVNGDELKKLNISEPAELSKLVPGLTINLPAPDNPTIILRGVRWTDATGAAAIPVYINEIPFEPQYTITNIYDVGQVEVLRGPQGTSRGAPSISGAITIATERPDLNNYGGYASAQVGQHSRIDAQGAVNIPLIPDKLAVRLAGDFQNSEGNQVRSINDPRAPNFEQYSGRITARFEPTDDLKFTVMYQRNSSRSYLYDQVSGTGSLGFSTTASAGAPSQQIVAPNYNGPAIAPNQRLSVEQTGNTRNTGVNLISFNAVWDVLGQELSYNFGYQHTDNSGVIIFPSEIANQTPGSTTLQIDLEPANQETWHELRLSSQRGGEHFLDYDLGIYSNTSFGDFTVSQPAFFAPGAFGNPASLPSPFSAPLSRYTIATNYGFHLGLKNFSAYGNVVLHLPFDTELSGGLRWMHDHRVSVLNVATGAANAAFPNPTGGAFPCSAFGFSASPIYGGGTCDLPIPAGTLPVEAFDSRYKPVLYNVSLSHKFAPNILGYATVGTSWRPGGSAIGNIGFPNQYLISNPEKATSFEVGFKTSWGRRLRINADIFQINYNGQLTVFQNIPYYNSLSGVTNLTNLGYLSNANARVRGVEADISAKPLDNLTLTASASYSAIVSAGGNVPCNNPNVAITATNPLNFCPAAKGANLNASPRLQLTLNGEYTHPIGASDGYFRFNVNEQGRNPNFGTSLTSTGAYATVDLFAGITTHEGQWDFGVYAKNVLDKQVVLTNNPIAQGNGIDQLFGPSGYNNINMNFPREIGGSVHFRF